MRTWESFSWYK